MYTIYHVPGIKVGCSIQPDRRVKSQGYNFYEVLQVCNTKEEASEREIYWQNKIGYGRDCNIPYSATLKLVAIAATPEVRAKARATQKVSEVWKASNKVRVEKMKTPEANAKKALANLKPVLQYERNKQGAFIKEWPSMKEAGRTLGINPGDISSCIRNRQKTAGGFIWKYKNS